VLFKSIGQKNELKLKLSVLDQTLSEGSNAVEALQESIQLAKACDKLGYNVLAFGTS